MFELGASLRDARRKRGLELDAVQRATRIRRRYLEAIEDERFDLLPGVAYARGFLREYAEFLGLDGALYVQEYNERFAPREEALQIAPRRTARTRRRGSSVPLLIPAVLLAGALVVGLAVSKLGGGGGGHRNAATTTLVTAASTRRTATSPKHPTTTTRTHPAAPAPLVLTASRGDSWISVHLGSETGPVLWENTLHQGQTIRFGLRKPLWIRVGAGLNLDAYVGTRKVALPQLVGNVVVATP